MAGMQTVLIFGASGRTGSVIADALLDNPLFGVIAAVRPESANKPILQGFQKRGLKIVHSDLQSATLETLQEVLKGVDIVISCIIPLSTEPQKRLIDACKVAGVKRFVPSNWGTACVPGVMQMHDTKLEVSKYAKESGVPYTLIDVGWWMNISLPSIDLSKLSEVESKYFNKLYGSGDVPFAITDRRDIGKFVVRILADSSTINRYVFVWAEEVTLNQLLALAKKTTGQDVSQVHVTLDEVKSRISVAKKSIDEEPDNFTHILELIGMQYAESLWFRGDNTIENAKKPEYGSALDARELYPDVNFTRLEDFAVTYY